MASGLCVAFCSMSGACFVPGIDQQQAGVGTTGQQRVDVRADKCEHMTNAMRGQGLPEQVSAGAPCLLPVCYCGFWNAVLREQCGFCGCA